MNSMIQDLRFGTRTLLKTPGFTIAALLALAIGIGANTAIFSVVYSVMLKPLGYESPDRIVIIWEKSPQMEMSISYLDFLDWRARSKSFDSMAAMRRDSFNLVTSGEAERIQGRVVSWNFLKTFGAKVSIGRDFAESDDQVSALPTAILSYGLWQRRFGGRNDVVGQQVTLNNRQYTVIGVAPSSFEYGSGVDVFTPIELAKTASWTRGNHPGIYVIARMKEGVSLAQARAELDTVARAINQENQQDGARSIFTKITPVLENLISDVRQPLLIMTAAVVFMLLIASSNVANLLLARSTVRQRELAIRNAMGASRGRIVRQLLTESVLLSLIGGGAGILLAIWGVRLLRAAELTALPRVGEVNLHPPVLLFTAAVSILTGLVFGLAPALQGAKASVNDLLKDSARSGSRHHGRIRNVLIGSEVALALVMLIGAALTAKSIGKLLNTDTGFEPRNLLVLQTTLSAPQYNTAEATTQFLERVKQELETVPGVTAAAYGSGGPLLFASENSMYLPEADQKDPAQMHMTVRYSTDPNFKDVLGLRLLRGRFINDSDKKDSPAVVVIDDQLATEIFGNMDPIGKRLKYGDPASPVLAEVVGVVQHVKHYGLDGGGPVKGQSWMPATQGYKGQSPFFRGEAFLYVRYTGDPQSVISGVRAKMADIDPRQPLYNVQTYKQVLADVTETQRITTSLLGIFAVIALVLASIGIYGVMSYSVTQRTHEIGVRMALGAKRGDVVRMVLSQSMRVTCIGLAAGAVLGLVMTRFMKALLFGVRANDPVVFLGITLLLAAVAMFASFIPARRATKVDPMIALRYE